jgi:Nuclease-related domain
VNLIVRRPQASNQVGLAGESAARRFHQERITNLKREWKPWLGFVGLALLSIAFMVFFGRVGLAVGGLMLGFVTATCLFGWMIGFDVHALTWLWGSWGEEDTGNELARLGDEWFVRHDIANPYGNWDHVAVGPPGVFMIESKRLRGGPISIAHSGLSSGRIHFGAKTFLGASAGLRDALVAEADWCPWVQAVVAVWGEFPAEPQEKDRVVYMHGSGLIEWLESRSPRMGDDRRISLTQALQRL